MTRHKKGANKTGTATAAADPTVAAAPPMTAAAAAAQSPQVAAALNLLTKPIVLPPNPSREIVTGVMAIMQRIADQAATRPPRYLLVEWEEPPGPLPTVSRDPLVQMMCEMTYTRIQAAITKHRNELIYHAEQVFQFSRRCYELYGEGCVYWFLSHLSIAEDPDPAKRPALLYRTFMQSIDFEYPPVMQAMAANNYLGTCVVLVAIRYSDNADSIMHCIMLPPTARTLMMEQTNGDPPRLHQKHLTFMPVMDLSGPVLNVNVEDHETMCDNPRCFRVMKDAAFKKCGGCLLYQYCSKECQAAHWKLSHRSTCKTAKEVVEAVRDHPVYGGHAAREAREAAATAAATAAAASAPLPVAPATPAPAAPAAPAPAFTPTPTSAVPSTLSSASSGGGGGWNDVDD